jgi:lipoprotein-releasing system permease protein
MNWELMVGTRYLRSRRRAFLSLISALSLAGVTIGVATLLIVLAVMSGLESELRNKILGFNPQVTLASFTGGLTDWRDVLERVRQVPDVQAASPVVYGQAMVGLGRSVSGVIVRGIDPKEGADVIDVGRHLVSGRLEDLGRSHPVTLPPEDGGGVVQLPAIVIGQELAKQLGVELGEVLNVISPLGTPGPTGMVPRMKRFVLVGVFDSGMFEYDTTLTYMDLAEAQRFFDQGDTVSAIEVRVQSLYGARDTARAIERAVGGFPFRARDWMEVNRNLFSALKLEKVVYGIVLTLIVVVAAFNILASLTMVVKEKRRDIAILNGAVIGVAGTTLGTLLGLAGCWLLSRYQFIDLPKDVFLVNTLPVRIDPLNFLVVALASIAICLVAALSPARRAASLVPVEVIRYE